MLRIKRPTSIRSTLLLLLLPFATFFMLLAWIIHGMLLDRMSRDFVQQRLTEEADFLEDTLVENQLTDNPLYRTADYFESVFHHAFVIHSQERTLISPSHWRPAFEPLLNTRKTGFISHRAYLSGSDDPLRLLVYRREVQINNQTILLLVAEDLTQIKASQSQLHVWAAIVVSGLLVMLIAMIYGAVLLSLRPTEQLQKALSRLQQGEITRLKLNPSPREFTPLINQLNLLLETLEQRLKRSREALANLSHSVKTPLSAVQQMLEDQSCPLTEEQRRQMALRLKDVHHQLEKEMRRSHFAGPQAGQNAKPVRQARDLLWVLGRLYPDKHFEMDISVDMDQCWPVEEQDMNELLGNLLDNAGKWAKSRVLMKLAETPDNLEIHIQDDGPGVDPRNLQELGTRGLRLDEQKPGYGLGLAIVHEIVTRYGGHLVFTNSPGLQVSIFLPGKIH
ncbi:ATP-binding protein [Marinospirillum sp.]|uniref:ATP-binding protein n=1 Tax=Marinospirillum sp. TaxID=2183934 RepID=UPI00384F4437